MKPDPTAFSPGSKLCGLNRIRFLLESLVDLDFSLKKIGSRLLVLHGEPGDVLIQCLKEVIISQYMMIHFHMFLEVLCIWSFGHISNDF